MMRIQNPNISVSERAQARDALAQLRNGGSLFVGVEHSRIALPETLTRDVENLLAALAAGETALVSSSNEELTTQQAAAFLKLSRPTVVKMMDEGRIPFRKPGKHRRVRTTDLLAFQEVLNRDRDAAMDELAALGQEVIRAAREEGSFRDEML
jgi:excisionase family DNA binding protein